MIESKDNKISKIPQKIRDLYEIVNELETDFPGRKFTLDGTSLEVSGKYWLLRDMD